MKKFIKNHLFIIINVIVLFIFIGLLAYNYTATTEIEILTYIALAGVIFQIYILLRYLRDHK